MVSSAGGATAPPTGAPGDNLFEVVVGQLFHFAWYLVRMAVSLWVIAVPVVFAAYLYFERAHIPTWQLALASILPVAWLILAARTGHLRGNWRMHHLRRTEASLQEHVKAKALPRYKVLHRRGKITGFELHAHIGWNHEQLIASIDDILTAYQLPPDVERDIISHAHGHVTVLLSTPVPIPDSYQINVDGLRALANESDGLTLGVGADGPISWNPQFAAHMLLVGVTGSGKSVLGYSLTAQAMLQGYKIIAIDPKRLDMAWLAAHAYRPATTPEESAGVLAGTEREMERRLDACQVAGVSHVRDLPTPPQPVLVVVEEAAELLDAGSKPAKDAPGMPEWVARSECLESIKSLARLGRAADVHLLLLAQRADASVLSGQLRSQLAAHVVVRDAGGPEAMKMVGLTAEEAEAFTASGPQSGRFIASFGAGTGWTVGQAPFVSMETLRSLA